MTDEAKALTEQEIDLIEEGADVLGKVERWQAVRLVRDLRKARELLRKFRKSGCPLCGDAKTPTAKCWPGCELAAFLGTGGGDVG